MRLWLALIALMGAPIAIAQSADAQGAAAKVLPMVKPLHLVLTPPAATVPAACRRYAGAFAGQFANGPYANLIITSVTAGPEGCVFRGTYAWSGYPANPQPGTTQIGPTEFLDGSMSGADLHLGNPNNTGMVVHPDLHAEFYMQGSLVSRAVLARLPAAQLQ
jgi:hypothetical protein